MFRTHVNETERDSNESEARGLRCKQQDCVTSRVTHLEYPFLSAGRRVHTTLTTVYQLERDPEG